MRLSTISSFSPLSIPLKMVIVGLVTALGGSGYIGFLSEYATYYYAWNSGFRLPAEGSPYLKITISSISFMLIIFSSFIFIAFYITMRLIHRVKSTLNEQETSLVASLAEDSKLKKFILKAQKKLGEINELYTLIAAGILTSGTIFVVISFYAEPPVTSLPLRLAISLASGLFYFIQALPITNKNFIVPSALLLTASFLIFSPFILFNQNIYSEILREIGYGGGIHTTISQNETNINYQLLLRTNDSLFVKNLNNTPIEIPLNQVNIISYNSKY